MADQDPSTNPLDTLSVAKLSPRDLVAPKSGATC
jgi:hypothetical protein